MSVQFFLSLTSALTIGAAAAYLGSLMLEKRMALAAGPLGHLALPGVALAIIYGFDLSLGAFPFVVLGIVIIWLLELKTKLPTEALTAFVFSVGVAIFLLFLPLNKAEEALVGNITSVGVSSTIITVILSLLIIVVVRKIYHKMLLINISEDLAFVEKINIKKYNFIYLLAIAIIVALGVKLVGGLLTAALVSIPAVTARNFARNMKSYSILSLLFGILAPLFGLILFKFTHYPAGVLVILSGAFFFLLSLFFVKKTAS